MFIRYYIIYFILLSFMGYLYETAAMTLWSGKFENRGFFFGPIIPIYGAGAVCGTILLTFHFAGLRGIWIFFIGLFASAILEYPTHWLLEKAFHKTWWDYSKAPLNINGRVSLLSSAGFGVAALLIVKVINPFLIPLLLLIPTKTAFVAASILGLIFACDFGLTIRTLLKNGNTKIARADARLDAKIGASINPYLNEDKRLSKYFYSAVDKVEEKLR